MEHAKRCGFGFVAALLLMVSPAFGANILINGDFETGDFTGWSVASPLGGLGSFVVDDDDGVTPISSNPSVGPASGNFYATSDQTGAGTNVLLQTFAISPSPAVILSFDMFVNDWSGAGPIIDPIGLDHTGPANQHARVDILSAGASPLDTGAGVLATFYLGVDPFFTNPNPYTSYSFDITSLVGVGGTFQLRFAQVDNQLFLNQGVDNVSIDTVPEPRSTILFISGLLALLTLRNIRPSLLRRK